MAEASCVAVHFGVKPKGPAPGSQNPVDGSSSKGDEDDTRVAGARSVAGASCKAVRIRDADINSKERSVCDTEVSTLSAKTLCCGLSTLSAIMREGGVVIPPVDKVCFANIIDITMREAILAETRSTTPLFLLGNARADGGAFAGLFRDRVSSFGKANADGGSPLAVSSLPLYLPLPRPLPL